MGPKARVMESTRGLWCLALESMSRTTVLSHFSLLQETFLVEMHMSVTAEQNHPSTPTLLLPASVGPICQ